MFACTPSPQPGVTTTTVVSVAPAMSSSTWPTPTVSTRTHGVPLASSTRIAWGAAAARPPSWPRVAIERMNTSGSVAWRAHAHTVAEDRAAGTRARRIDREHRHRIALRPEDTHDLIGERRLPGTAARR